MQSELEAFLAAQGVKCRSLDPAAMNAVRSQWLTTFASKVLQQKGTEIFNGFMWHGFSFGIESAIEGEAARREYQKQFQAAFVVFDEDWNYCLACEPTAYPDLTDLTDDLYVAHHNMKWTMVFTHEQPGIGPFFASKSPRAK